MNTQQILDRVGRLEEYEVQVQMPEEWPFDMEIVGDQAFVTVLAESIGEATSRAREYINSLAEEDE